jgi:Arm DNA-binding domain
MKLTQKTIAALSLAEGKTETIVFDDELPGFGIRIRVGGSRTWIYQYKIGNQNRRVTLGSLAAQTPTRARETAGDLHAMVRLGRDPAVAKSGGSE